MSPQQTRRSARQDQIQEEIKAIARRIPAILADFLQYEKRDFITLSHENAALELAKRGAIGKRVRVDGELSGKTYSISGAQQKLIVQAIKEALCQGKIISSRDELGQIILSVPKAPVTIRRYTSAHIAHLVHTHS